MERIKKSSILKIICYILIPILFLEVIFGVLYIQYQSDNKTNLEKADYYKTDNFLYEEYFTNLRNLFIQCNYIKKNEQTNNQSKKALENDIEIYNYYGYTLIQETPQKIYYTPDYRFSNECFSYIIVDTKTTNIYTNIKSNDYSKEIELLQNQKYNWILENGKIRTELEDLQEMQIKYQYGLENIEELKESGFNIYFNFDDTKVTDASSIQLKKAVYDMAIQAKDSQIILFIVSVFLLLLISIYLIWSIGYTTKSEGVYLSDFDKFYYEIICLVVFAAVAFCLSILSNIFALRNVYQYVLFLMFYFIGYIACAVLGVTTIKRLKTRTLIKSSLTYSMWKWTTNKIKSMLDVLFYDKSITVKLGIYYIGFLFISTIVLVICYESGVMVLFLLAFWAWAFYKMLKYTRKLNMIQNSLRDIYEGKEEVKIEEDNLEPSLKQMVKHINSISNGLTKAVEESLKSERMKTELITNVSHDIKTPLTSIISYVDLLKKEDMPTDKAKEYLEILDNKSQRLKRLTEDLVEASKASSGNIKLNIEKIKVKELILQISGEFEDKFNEKNLELILNMPKTDISIRADSRYLYRVVENMYTNIVKYALEGSRVYVDVIDNNDNIQIQLKNISKAKLNITTDELMQRFVRGETSRNTEGSGLGLSIAESLTKLQNGNFNIYLDGDLFKVTIEFEKVIK